MLTIKNVTMRNFLSCGNVAQTVELNKNGLTLVLGENLDLGGNGSRNGVGKAQPLTAKIYSPSGWIAMKELKVGSNIYAADGTITTVTGIYPQGIIPTYKITFSDGRSTAASGDHLWSIYSHMFSNKNKIRLLTTAEIIDLMDRSKNNRSNSNTSNYMYVPRFIPENIKDIDLPIDPYLLGAMIGDGTLKDGIGFTSADEYLSKKVSNLLEQGWNCYLKQKKNRPIQYGIKMIKRQKINPFRKKIESLGLNVGSHLKFIPKSYLSSSIDQRIKLLQGLIDTDGYVSENGSISFTTVSPMLANDVVYLVRSIGGLAKMQLKSNKTYSYAGQRVLCRDSYTVSVRYHNPKALVSLPRKANRISERYQYQNLKLRITSIERIEDQECQCIMIDHPSHLYVTDDYIVTHNTTIMQAISYGLFGQSLTNIKINNLINNINQKNMMVSIEFEKNGHNYRIERGRKPNFFRYIIDNKNIDETTDDAQGENRETQKEIDQLLGMSHSLFKHIIALNTYTEPFLDMGAGKQREIIEELLGVTLLSQKAENLKELIKTTKTQIEQEEFRIRTVKQSNERIKGHIEELERRSATWDDAHAQHIDDITISITELEKLDIEAELQSHRDKELLTQLTASKATITRELSTKTRHLQQNTSRLQTVLTNYDRATNHECPTCGQEIHDASHELIRQQLEQEILELDSQILLEQEEITVCNDQLLKINEVLLGIVSPQTIYKNLEEALNHRNTLDSLHKELAKEQLATNPYKDQNSSLQETMQEITYDQLNKLVRLRDHQEFLLKLLTNKESFIRKRIIDQNLAWLNSKLNEYLDKLGLPHTVKFINDLSVEISLLGQELDFGNFSRGERTRLILALSWAFRDIFENTSHAINLVFVDELLDNGMDAQGLEGSVSILKKMERERNKNIFVISHREELINRVSAVLTVLKENSFSSFSWDHVPAV